MTSRMTAGRRGPSVGPTWALLMVVLTLGGILIGRLVQWQVLDRAEFGEAAAATNSRVVMEPAVRGRILAADGTPLVANTPSAVVTLDPSALANSDDEGQALLSDVAAQLGLAPADVWGRTKVCGSEGAPSVPLCFSGSPYQPIPIARDVDPVAALSLLERPEDYPGVAVETVPLRSYPADEVNAAHILGYLGAPSAQEVAASVEDAGGDERRALAPVDLVGRTGLESVYDGPLRGTPGRTVVAVDPRGVVTGQVSHDKPVPGLDLRTHINADVQVSAESALEDAVAAATDAGRPPKGAAAVVLEVNSGAVIAQASWPTYDPSIWTSGISASDYEDLVAPGGGQPLVDRALADTYPPASTFKAFSLPAALATGIDLEGQYECPGSLEIAGQTFTNFESQAYGELDLQEVMEVSCDTVFYQWAYQNWLDLGGVSQSLDLQDPYILLAQDFGFGAVSGIDLPGEVSGRVTGREAKAAAWEASNDEVCDRAERGYPLVDDVERREFLEQSARDNCEQGGQYRPGDAVNLSIGQGGVVVTPVQLASAYAAVANGGTLWTPQVAADTRQQDGTVVEVFEPQQRGEISLPSQSWQVVRDGLAGVNTNGTGQDAFEGFDLEAYPVAGKTGSAEGLGARATAWYASYGPISDPEYAVAVVVDEGGLGGEIAAPAARQIWDVLAAK